MAEAFRPRPPEEKPSETTLDRFFLVASDLVQEKIDALTDGEPLDITPEEIFAAVEQLPMRPANDRMSDEDMRELLVRGSDIERAATALIATHRELKEE